MKAPIIIAAGITIAGLLNSCKNDDERYIDLSSGQVIVPEKDSRNGVMIDKNTGKALDIYVDSKTHDTIYGPTGKVINGHVLVVGSDKKYVYDGDDKLKIDNSGAVKYKDGDYKVEIEKDGDMTTKTGDRKVKEDGKTGEKKVKKD